MGKGAKTAWGIDLGNSTLKAIKVGQTDGGVEVLDFAVIEYDGKILSQSEIDEQQRMDLIDRALERFVEEHEITKDAMVVSVPGQSSFSRFVKLPPVDKKSIPRTVTYEAVQQIPFDIEDVEWDWQAFEDNDSPEVEVGIFAIKKELVNNALDPFVRAGINVGSVQMSPMALYNFLSYDQKFLEESGGKDAVIALDIGADNTDLVIADGVRVWQRSIPIGGNQFTEAVQKAFKLSFAKAEALKRTASTSKYARQIFQAMRSVFADLAAEVQRSLGFYSSSNRQVKFKEVVALGNAIKMPGLVKFLQQSLSLPVKRLDTFDSLTVSPDVSMAQYTENLPSLATVYGLALQALGKGQINSNLLPTEIVKKSQWKQKRIWFTVSAAVFVMSSMLFLFQAISQGMQADTAIKDLDKFLRRSKIIDSNANDKKKYETIISEAEKSIKQDSNVYASRNLVPKILRSIRECLPNVSNVFDPAQVAMHTAFAEGNRDVVMEMPRKQREQVFLSNVKIIYTNNLNRGFDEILSEWKTKQTESAAPSTQKKTKKDLFGGKGGFSLFGGKKKKKGALPSGSGSAKNRRAVGSDGFSKDVVPGFVVLIEGSTPHEKGFEYLFPQNVGVDRDQWGFYNRLLYLGKTDKRILEAENKTDDKSNSKKTTKNKVARSGPMTPLARLENQRMAKMPFEAYVPSMDKLELYFDTLDHGLITTKNLKNDVQPPNYNFGIQRAEDTTPGNLDSSVKAITQSGKLDSVQPLKAFYDPFTLEPITKTYVKDDRGFVILNRRGEPTMNNNDYWFRLKLKIKLKGSTKK